MKGRRIAGPIVFLGFAITYVCVGSTSAPSPRSNQFNADSFSNSKSSHEVSNLFFADHVHGRMTVIDHVTGATYIVRTLDAGQSWEKFDAPPGTRQLYFKGSTRGWALRWYRDPKWPQARVRLLGTKDGGAHWAALSTKITFNAIPQVDEFIKSLAFSDDLEGWLVGDGAIFRTNDGGRTFTRLDHISGEGILNCSGVYAGTKTGVLLYGSGFVLRSVDNGSTWTPAINMQDLDIDRSTFTIASAKFLGDGLRGWMAGQAGYGAIITTSDFGQTWRIEFQDRGGTIFQDLWLTDRRHRCAVGNSTHLFCTDNDGLTWNSRNVLPVPSTGQARIFKRIVLLDSGRGWVVRLGGYLYGTTDSGKTWHEVDPLNMP